MKTRKILNFVVVMIWLSGGGQNVNAQKEKSYEYGKVDQALKENKATDLRLELDNSGKAVFKNSGATGAGRTVMGTYIPTKPELFPEKSNVTPPSKPSQPQPTPTPTTPQSKQEPQWYCSETNARYWTQESRDRACNWAKAEREGRVAKIDGKWFSYDTKEDADAAQEGRRYNGVNYRTKEDADAVREGRRYKGVNYRTKEDANAEREGRRYNGVNYSTKESRIEAERIDDEKRQKAKVKRHFQEKIAVLGSEFKGMDDNSAKNTKESSRFVVENKSFQQKIAALESEFKGMGGNNPVENTATISHRPPASTNNNVQLSKRPKADKIEIVKTIGELSQKNLFDKAIDASEELLSSMLETKFKPEEHHLEAALKQTIHSVVVNPIKEVADGALDNSLLKAIPKESIMDEIKRDLIRRFSELQHIKLNYFDYERIQENILALTKVGEKVTFNLVEYDKRAIIGAANGTRSVQQHKREEWEKYRKNTNTISEGVRKTRY